MSENTVKQADHADLSCLQAIRKYSVPCILSLLVGSLYNIVDQIFIATTPGLGANGNAATNAVFPLTVLALAVATWIGDGACTKISISLGSGEEKPAGKAAGNAIVLSLLCGFLLLAVYLLFSDFWLVLFGAGVSEITMNLASEYFFWICIGLPVYLFSQAMNPVIRADGSPAFAMICILAGALTNVVLDPLFLFVFKMGISGAAIATILGQLVSSLISLVRILNFRQIELKARDLILSNRILSDMARYGFSSFLTQFSLVISMAAANTSLVRCTLSDPIYSSPDLVSIPMAAFGIVMKFFQIAISISIGLAAGLIPVIGYDMGSKNYQRVLEIFRYILAFEFVIGLICLAAVELFPVQLISLFGAANESQYYTDFAVRCFREYLCLLPLSMVNKGIFIFLQAMGKSWQSAFLSFFREVVLGAGLVTLMPVFMGMSGILWSMPASEVITGILCLLFCLRIIGSLKSKAHQIKAASEPAVSGI